MNNSEKISLKWNDFSEENFSSALKELRKDSDFCDVTLAFEDGQQIEAHKVVLSSSSPFFREILTKIKHPHPLIYMRSTKSDDFVGILDFLYFGEANVSQDHLDSFLELAGELKLKGLTEAPGQVNEEIIKDDLHQIKPKEEEINEEEQRFTKEERIVAISNQSVSTTNEDLNRQIKAMMSKGPVILEGSQRGRTARICNVCGKEGTVTAITGHIENNHITGVSHVCDICGRINRSRYTLVKHMRSYHSQVSFSEQDHLTSSTRNQVVADIIDVTLAPKDKEDRQVLFNSVAPPPSTNPPSAPPSPCIESQPATTPTSNSPPPSTMTNQSVSSTNEDLDRQIKSMMSKGRVILEGSQRGRTTRICNVCGKEGKMQSISNHIEYYHITGVSHDCDICGKINKSRQGLMKHMRSDHTQDSFSEQDPFKSSTRTQVDADIIDVTLAPKEDLQVVFNSVATPRSTNPPSAPPSTCIEPQPTTRPPFTPGWKVDNTKQSNPGSPTSSASSPSTPSPETLAANSQVFKCKQGENLNTRMCNDCDFHWPDLHTLKIHEFNYHGGPYPS